MSNLTIFDEQISRKPNLYPWTQKFIDAMWAGHWTPNEFSFNSDIQQFKTELTDREREIVKRALSAIGQIEVAVKKFWARLGDNLPHPSLVDLGYVMANIEVIHSTAYEKLLVVLGLEKEFEENLKLDIIIGRVKYLKKYNEKIYTDKRKQYIYAIILFTLFVENVSLFSQFYIIKWLARYRNVLKDVDQQVNYTIKEEHIHALVGIQVINTIRKEFPDLFDDELEQKVLHEAEEAFKAESKIIDWMLEDYSGPRINPDVVKEYVKYKINDSLRQIGYKKIYKIDPTLHRDFEWFIEETLAPNLTDFFHQRPVDYSKKSKSFSADDMFS